MNKTMASAQYTSLLLGISLVDIQSILSVLLLIISLVVGIINLVLIIKKALKDGKIDEDEKKEITEAVTDIAVKVEDITEKVENIIEDSNKNKQN